MEIHWCCLAVLDVKSDKKSNFLFAIEASANMDGL